jgi:ABC-type uncharacterized transport system substrate-binding protein
MRRASLLALSAASWAAPTGLAAHPHVFVEADVEVVAEAGAVTAVRLTWTYDDLFSLILAEDLGLDADGDLQLTGEELAALQAHVADWPPDFAGDLVVEAGGAPLPLAPREEHGVAYREGVVVESHRRPLAGPAPATNAPVAVEVYDPYYYVAYEVRSVTVSGDPDCAATLIRADLDAAQAEVDATWAGIDWAGAAPDVQLPPIGEAFADRVEVRCGG